MTTRVLFIATRLAVTCTGAAAQAQTRPDQLPSGLERKYSSREGLGEKDDFWTGRVRTGKIADNKLGGSNAADAFDGAAGNDMLIGYAGFDTHTFKLGDGDDTILVFLGMLWLLVASLRRNV